VVTLIVVGFVFVGWAANQIVFGLLQLLVRKRDIYWRGLVGRARLKVRIAVMIVALGLAVTVSPLDPGPSLFIRQTLLFLFVLTVGWMLAGASDMWALVYMRRFNMGEEDNLVARKHVTQIRILQRVAGLLIGIVTLGLALMTIGAVRQWGMGLLASAGTGTGLDHLKQLGVNMIELLPVAEFDNGVNDFNWGYATAYFFAPEASYAHEPLKGSQYYEFNHLVNELHRRTRRPLLAAWPHELLGRIADFAGFAGRAPRFDVDSVAQAWSSLFGAEAPQSGNLGEV